MKMTIDEEGEMKKNQEIDFSDLLEKILAEELSKEISKDVINTIMFDSKVSDIKANNREGIIGEIINDIPFTPINIEETEEFKKLSKENQEKYLKNGRIL